jgi:hypothetical protein
VTTTRWLLGGVAVTLMGCSDRPSADDAAAAAAAAPAGGAPAQPGDSLVATLADGYEIWFTLARADSGPEGPCVDRAVEIRHKGRRTPVPLLYTRTTPEAVDDSTIRARLSDHCAPGDRYLVDLRSGRPVRER